MYIYCISVYYAAWDAWAYAYASRDDSLTLHPSILHKLTWCRPWPTSLGSPRTSSTASFRPSASSLENVWPKAPKWSQLPSSLVAATMSSKWQYSQSQRCGNDIRPIASGPHGSTHAHTQTEAQTENSPHCKNLNCQPVVQVQPSRRSELILIRPVDGIYDRVSHSLLQLLLL